MPDAETTCVYQFKVVLRDVSPMVWRRLFLRSGQSIADLHYWCKSGASAGAGLNNL